MFQNNWLLTMICSYNLFVILLLFNLWIEAYSNCKSYQSSVTVTLRLLILFLTLIYIFFIIYQTWKGMPRTLQRKMKKKLYLNNRKSKKDYNTLLSQCIRTAHVLHFSRYRNFITLCCIYNMFVSQGSCIYT